MSKMNSFLENKVMPVAGRIAGQRHLQSLRDGIVLTTPLIIIGSIFLILCALPIPGYADFMASIFGSDWATKMSYPVNATFDIMGLIAAFGIAHSLAEKYKMDSLTAGAISVATFLLVTPFQTLFTPEGGKEILVTGVIPAGYMGSKGLFVAMIVAMLSTEIYRFILKRNIVIRMPDGVPPSVSKSFVALIPGTIIITLFWVIRLVIEQTSFESIHTIIGDLLYTPLSAFGSSLFGAIVAVILIQLLWSCGLHGASIVGAVMSPIWLTLMDANRVAFQAGKEVSNIITPQFFDLWIYMGGSGATLALVVVMLIRAKSQQAKVLSRLSIGPGIFNINEPIVFGMPIVMNPMLMIPFIATPLVLALTSYFAMDFGWVAKPSGVAVPWTTPPIISGYLATGGKISGAVMQIVNFAIAFIMYYPFVRSWDKQNLKQEQSTQQAS